MAVEKVKEEFGLKMDKEQTDGIIKSIVRFIVAAIIFLLETIKETMKIVFRKE